MDERRLSYCGRGVDRGYTGKGGRIKGKNEFAVKVRGEVMDSPRGVSVCTLVIV